MLVISPWSTGGYVNSQVFDHTSIIRFIEKRFGVHERNISPWRRAVAGDLTTMFNFATPNQAPVNLPSTASFLPPASDLSSSTVPSFQPTLDTVLFGTPTQEPGIRRARALPYELEVRDTVSLATSTVTLKFLNTGTAASVFQVRSVNPTDAVRMYTVEAGKSLQGSWPVAGSYELSVYGPNGFVRHFKGSVNAGAAALAVEAHYGKDDSGSLNWRICNVSGAGLTVHVLDAYTGRKVSQKLGDTETIDGDWSLDAFCGWYDLVVTVDQDASFERRLSGHVETGRDSYSDPALGGLVTLKA